MKKPYFPENYKEKSIPHPYESGRKLLPTSNQETGLAIDEDGNFHYPDTNQKAERRDITSGKDVMDTGENVYDREQELLDAMTNDDEVPERVKNAEEYNRRKAEREESNENHKYDKFKDYDGESDIEEDEHEDEEPEDTLQENPADEAEDQNRYYESKIAKSKGNVWIDATQNNFYPNKNPNKDRRHGRERHGDFRDSNRAERQYTKRALKENLLK